MSTANLGWLFYKDYFNDLDYTNLKSDRNQKKIEEKINTLINTKPDTQKSQELGQHSFEATTVYPGLLLGSGYAHELPDVKSQAILGFHFDYTTGLPVIPGSTIKGVLRSAFAHASYIREIAKDDTLDVEALEKEIFDNEDIFFDATIVNYTQQILGDDYITPHKSPYKDPIPLRFIKVMPGVTFRFEFKLNDGKSMDADSKLLLFAQILSDLGVGAKTNVGYGQFDEKFVTKIKRDVEKQIEDRKKEAQDRKKREEEERRKAAMQSLASDADKILFEIEGKEKKDVKDIYEILQKYTLTEENNRKLLAHFQQLLGPKPKPKNKAVVKWTIKIYEYLGA